MSLSVCTRSAVVPSWDGEVVSDNLTGASRVLGSGGMTLVVDTIDVRPILQVSPATFVLSWLVASSFTAKWS